MAQPGGVAALLKLYLDIALCRRGPQDVPASAFLLGATLAAYFICNLILGAFVPPLTGWPAFLLADAVLTLAWYKGVLAIARKPARFVQTASASFGYQLVFTPLTVPLAWLTVHYGQQPAWLPALAGLQIAMLVWTLAINGRILTHSTEWPLAACVPLVLLQLMLQQYLLLRFFPQV